MNGILWFIGGAFTMLGTIVIMSHLYRMKKKVEFMELANDVRNVSGLRETLNELKRRRELLRKEERERMR